MVIASVSTTEFVDFLRAEQLLQPGQLKELTQELLPHVQDPQALADQLVQRGWLTAYQSQQLLQGQGKELVLGPYRLVEPLGEGGMGQVFKAIHQRLGRVVALKIIRPERVSQNPDAIPRFQREARAAAQLSHPNVVILYDADQIEGRHFIAMEYVEGIDLARLVRECGPLPLAEVCDYIRQAALGLQHAHERDMVHRDIKPSNLLVSCASRNIKVSPESFPWPEAVVKILDMGLARMIGPGDSSSVDSSLTREGFLMGTPDYISPEQARNSHNVDIRSDLYSLGCTFYFILTGRPPFPQGTTIEKLLMHQLDDPQPVEEIRPGLPLEVISIVRKLMAKRPQDRLQTPAKVAEVLESLRLEGKSAAARSGRKAVDQAAALTQVVPIQITPAGPRPEPVAADNIQAAKKIAVLKGHRGWVMALAFAPNRDLLASGGVDTTVRLWDFRWKRPREVAVPPAHRGDVNALAFAPDSKMLASGSGTLDGLIWLWNLAGEQPEERAALHGHSTPVDALAFSPDGQLLASGGGTSVRLWEMNGPKARERLAFKGHTDYVKSVAFAPDSKTLASGSQDGTVRLWNVGRKLWAKEQAVLFGHRGQVHSVSFSGDGKALASGGMDQTVRLWDLTGTKPCQRHVLAGHHSVVRSVLFTPEGTSLVSVEAAGLVIIWEVATGNKLCECMLPGAMVSSVALTYDGRYLATANSDGHVLVFRLATKGEPRQAETAGPWTELPARQ